MLCDPDIFNTLGNQLLTGITQAFATRGLDAVNAHLAMGPIPAEDCCPDLVVWVSNIRIWDASSPDNLQENRLLMHFGLAFDLNVRIGLCYIESDDDGGPVDPVQLQAWTETINRYGHAAYVGGLQALLSHEDNGCDVDLRPNPMDPYNSGGCAGYTYTVSVSVI